MLYNVPATWHGSGGKSSLWYVSGDSLCPGLPRNQTSLVHFFLLVIYTSLPLFSPLLFPFSSLPPSIRSKQAVCLLNEPWLLLLSIMYLTCLLSAVYILAHYHQASSTPAIIWAVEPHSSYWQHVDASCRHTGHHQTGIRSHDERNRKYSVSKRRPRIKRSALPLEQGNAFLTPFLFQWRRKSPNST